MARFYDGFDIESFEAGHNLWHARIRRADAMPVSSTASFSPLELGFAWSDRLPRLPTPSTISTDSDRACGPDRVSDNAVSADPHNETAFMLHLVPKFAYSTAVTNPLSGLRGQPRGAARHPWPRRRGILGHAMRRVQRDPSGYPAGRAQSAALPGLIEA